MRIRNPRKCWHQQLQRLTLSALAVAVSACADGPTSPTARSSDLAPDAAVFARASMINVCHRTGSGSYDLLTINGNALAAHLAHGDAAPGAEAPDGTGATLGSDCVPQTEDVTGTYTLRTLGGETVPALGTGELVISMTIVLNEDGSCSFSGTARPAQEDPNGEIEEVAFDSCSYTLSGAELTLALTSEGEEVTMTAQLVGDEITLQVRIWNDADGSDEEDAPFGDAVFVKV